MIVKSNCIVCKGRYPKQYCGREQCPIVLKALATAKVKEFSVSDEIKADSPAVFVGRYGYPKVNVGLLTPPERKEDTWLYDAPREWAGRQFRVGNVVDYRSSLINSRFKSEVKIGPGKSGKLVEVAQEITQASKPVDLEVNLSKKPKFQTNFDAHTAPTGPAGDLSKVNVVDRKSVV